MNVRIEYHQGNGAGSVPCTTLEELVKQAKDFAGRRHGVGTDYDHVTIHIDGLRFVLQAAPGRQREDKLAYLVAQLEARDEEVAPASCQLAVDDLVYDHVGTSKTCSNINNHGYAVQLEEVAARIGLDATEEEVKRIVGLPPEELP